MSGVLEGYVNSELEYKTLFSGDKASWFTLKIPHLIRPEDEEQRFSLVLIELRNVDIELNINDRIMISGETVWFESDPERRIKLICRRLKDIEIFEFIPPEDYFKKVPVVEVIEETTIEAQGSLF